MSRTRSGPGEHADAISAAARDVLGRIRRMAVTLTSSAIWQVAGHILLDGDLETRPAEAFTGFGFYARPPAGGTPEAIVVFPGGAANAVIVGTRDEKTRREVFKVVGKLAAGETAVFNAGSIVILKADGTIEIRSIGGVAAPVATKADLSTLVTALTTATAAIIAGNPTGAAALQALADVLNPAPGAWPVGTTKVKLE